MLQRLQPGPQVPPAQERGASCVLSSALRDQVAPGTLNLHEPEGAEGFDLVPLHPKQRRIDHALSNSFGFGGTNAALVLSRPEA